MKLVIHPEFLPDAEQPILIQHAALPVPPHNYWEERAKTAEERCELLQASIRCAAEYLQAYAPGLALEVLESAMRQ